MIWFLWPETSGRSLEELAFCMCPKTLKCVAVQISNKFATVFEDKEEFAQRAEAAVTKTVMHHDSDKQSHVAEHEKV